MAEIVFSRRHRLGKEAARARLARLESKLEERSGVKLTWRGDRATVSGPGVSGTIALGEEAVDVEVKLGLLLRPLQGQIREAMERHIDRALT